MIGIIGAMEIEVDGIVERLCDKSERVINSLTFHIGKIGGRDVVVNRCGIGKVNSAMAAAVMIHCFSAKVIISTGVAGGVAPFIRQGDVAIASDCVQHDYFEGDGQAEKRFSCDTALVERMGEALKNYNAVVYKGVIVTGDQFICDSDKARELNIKYDAIACDMESGAIAQVCSIMGCRFLSMRAISDGGDDTAVGDFFAFVEKAAKVSINALCQFIGEL